MRADTQADRGRAGQVQADLDQDAAVIAEAAGARHGGLLLLLPFVLLLYQNCYYNYHSVLLIHFHL